MYNSMVDAYDFYYNLGSSINIHFMSVSDQFCSQTTSSNSMLEFFLVTNFLINIFTFYE